MMMRRVFFIMLLILAGIALAACSSMNNRKYSYVPPPDVPGAKHCTAQCWQGKNSCQQICAMKNSTCRAEAHENATLRYEQYKKQRLVQGQPLKKSFQNFQRTASCKHACHCVPAFNTCYTACGGQVTERF